MCVTNTGGVPEQIKEGKTGWVVRFEGAKEMAERILLTSTDRAMLIQMRKNCRNWIVENHTLEHMLDEYLDFYKTIIK